MIVAYNIIPLTEIQNETRCDAEFYHPMYENLEKLFHQLNTFDKLGTLCKTVRKGIFDINPSAYTNSGIPLVRTSQIKAPISGDEGVVFISEYDHRRHFLKTELSSGDIVFTKIGAGIGDVSILSNAYEKYNFSQNVAGLSISRDGIDPYYLIAFLACEYGKKQIVRYMMPSGQGKLELRDIKKIKIPRLGGEEANIAATFRESEKLLHSSKEKYTTAQQLLESELGLDTLQFAKPIGYTARFSELELSRRADAEFFNPEYQAIINLAKEHSPSPLGRLFSIRRGVCIDPKLYNEESGRPYIRIKELSLNQPLSENDSVRIGEKYIASSFPQARAGDYILAVIGATIGKINFISDELDGSLFSNNTACLSPKLHIEHPNAHELLLRSEIIQKQIQQRMAKTAQEKISDPELKRILVPTLPNPVLEQLENLVVSSKQNHFLSKQLLNQAKTRVEQLIEEAARP